LFGLHTPNSPNLAELDDFGSRMGKAPASVLFFRTLSDPYPADAVAANWAQGVMPMVTFEPIVKDLGAPQPLLRDITNGVWDDVFNGWAEASAQQDLPLAFRFAQEMNGNWYSWSDGRLGNAKGDYIAAWRHVHDIFEAKGADDISWTWSVNRVDTLPDKTLARVYPGDAYVDWAGVSGYYRNAAGGPPSFDLTFSKTLAELKRVAPGKLINLTEVGAGVSDGDQAAWLTSFFGELPKHPEIIGFNYFNAFKQLNWQITSNVATDAFRAGVADSRYGSVVPLAGGS